jgi:RNA polymerase sigma-70 factor (ECF subfamily)
MVYSASSASVSSLQIGAFLCGYGVEPAIIKKNSKSRILRAHFERKVPSILMKAGQRNDVQDVGKEKLVPQKPDSELVEAAINGDADGFTELCRRYYPAMVAIAHSVLGDRHLAEDAAQQGFAKAVRKLPQLKRKERFARWLAAICRNAALDLVTSRKNLRTAEDLSLVTPKTNENDATEAIKEAMAQLPASYRELIFLRYYDGMSYENISAVLGLSEQAINGRLRRAKKKIADHLRRNGFGEVRL